jgi:hypothetical protein
MSDPTDIQNSIRRGGARDLMPGVAGESCMRTGEILPGDDSGLVPPITPRRARVDSAPPPIHAPRVA